MSNRDVGNLIRLAALGESAQSGPKIDKRLHRLQIRLLQQAERGGRQDEVTEAAVHRLLQIEAEHVVKVRPVQVRIDAEHLPEDGLARLHEVLREAAPLADPVRAGLGQGGAEGRVVGEGDARRVGGEQVAVIDLAADIALDQAEVFVCWDFDGLKPRV